MSNLFKDSLLERLEFLNQKSLVSKIKTMSPSEESCQCLLDQLNQIQSYYSGGIEAYLEKAKSLVSDLLKGKTELPDFFSTPTNITQMEFNQEYQSCEETARPFIGDVAIVLVAGGLGERLGSPQIKLSILCESISGMSFFELYLAYLKVFSEISGKKMHLFIMTSSDTHNATVEFLKQFETSSFLNVRVEMQDKVPSFTDLDCTLNVSDDLTLQTKPHGHGDVHFLLKRSGLIQKWIDSGIKYVYFIQDTNPFSLASLPMVLGNALSEMSLMTLVGVKRRCEEAVGALVVNKEGFVYNIEYNVFLNYFRSKGLELQTDKEGFCLYPGNINCFLIEVEEYSRILNNISSMKEFVNIKFDKQDTSRLLSSWRVESLMQDVTFSVSSPERIRIVMLDRSLCFTTCKNNMATGKILSAKGLPSETIVECENDIYYRNYQLLNYCNSMQETHPVRSKSVHSDDQQYEVEGIRLKRTPKIVLHPSFGVLIKDVQRNWVGTKFDRVDKTAMFVKGKVKFVNCKFDNSSVWIENSQQSGTFVIENLNLSGKKDEVLEFEHVDEQMSDSIRTYRIREGVKMTKIKI